MTNVFKELLTQLSLIANIDLQSLLVMFISFSLALAAVRSVIAPSERSLAYVVNWDIVTVGILLTSASRAAFCSCGI